jgi:hypothetical protein
MQLDVDAIARLEQKIKSHKESDESLVSTPVVVRVVALEVTAARPCRVGWAHAVEENAWHPADDGLP